MTAHDIMPECRYFMNCALIQAERIKIKMKDYIVNVSGDSSRAACLIKGTKNVLYDAGMAYSAGRMIEKLHYELDGAPLDAVILSHSHYDHVSGIPFLRKEWPDLRVYAGSYAAGVLEKPTVRDVIRGLNENAARIGGLPLPEYYDNALFVDQVVKDYDMLTIGNHEIRVFETPGHTKCSLSYLVDDDILFASETIGVFKGDWYMPCYMVGYQMALDSLEKLRQVPFRRLYVPHIGLHEGRPLPETWEWLRECRVRTREEIETIIKTYNTGEERIRAMLKCYHDGIVSEEEQPGEAFCLNAAATLRLVEKECREAKA